MENETWSDTDKWIFWVITLPFVMPAVAAFVVMMLGFTVIGLVLRGAGLLLQFVIVHILEIIDPLIEWYGARTPHKKV